MSSHSFFFAHGKDVPDDALDVLRSAVTDALTAFANGQPFKLTLARDDWQQNFERCSGWGGWIDDVVNGSDFATGQPRFTGFISNGRVLGKATAQILALALAKSKPVAVFDDGQLSAATRVVQVEAGNYKNGWWIE